MILYFTDSQYSATGLKDAFTEVFRTKTMLERFELCNFGVKVAVTATTIQDSSFVYFLITMVLELDQSSVDIGW